MKLSYQPYKGVRDFYPPDFRLQAYIFQKWIEVAELYGYERYDASPLEYLDLYRVKGQGNSEILNEQIYTFQDRGERQVALRPEMTPSLARMVAARQQSLAYPVRWYSLPNLWRYERPQKGRLREHWQLNVDILGLADQSAELELILIARSILAGFGATPQMYSIHVSSRSALEAIFKQWLQLDGLQTENLILLFDRYHKMGRVAFKEACWQILPPDTQIRRQAFTKLKALTKLRRLADLPPEIQDLEACRQLQKFLDDLDKLQVSNAVLDLTIVRGFDYYTGLVFEIFDNHRSNKRSLFGGGRYDNLLQSLGGRALPGAGFGLGDVTMADFLRTHRLLPDLKQALDLYVILLGEVDYVQAWPILKTLRSHKLKVAVDSRSLKAAKKLETALKREVDYVMFIGEEDLRKNSFNLKYLPAQIEKRLSLTRIITKLAAKKEGS